MWSFRTVTIGVALLMLGTVFTFLPLRSEVLTAHAQEEVTPPEGGTPSESATASSDASFSEGENKNIWDSTWGCITNPGECAADAALVPLGVVAYVFLVLANMLLGIAAAAFDFAVSTLVFKFAVYFGNSAGLLVGWAMMRDIGNILLVFGFVAIGIQTMLNVGHYSVGKTLPRLVIFAVLLNFSLFAAEAVIDATNAVASTIFEQAYECGSVGEDCTSGAIINKVMVLTGITSTLDPIGDFATFFGNGEKLQRIIAAVLGTLFVTITTIVFAMGALMLLSRAIVLAFLMITSPIGFAGMVIPQLNKVANEWWKTLINNALFAPTLLLLIFVSLKVAEGVATALSVNGKAPNIFDALFQSTLSNDFGGILIYLLTVGFLFGSLLAAKQFGIIGSDWAVGTAGKAIGFSTAGVFGFAGRRTIGRGASNYATKLRSTQFARTNLGRLVVGGLDTAAKGSFDVRSKSVLGGTLGKIPLGKTTIDLGHGQHGGFDHIVHEGEKKKQEYSKKLKATPRELTEKKRAEEALKDGKGRKDMLEEGLKGTERTQKASQATWATEAKNIDELVKQLGESQNARQAQISQLEDRVRNQPQGPGVASLDQQELSRLQAEQEYERDMVSQTISQRRSALQAEQSFYRDAISEFKNDLRETGTEVTNLTKAAEAAAKNANPQLQFAKQLRKEVGIDEEGRKDRGPLDMSRPLRWATAAPEVHEHAAHEIDEWASKSKSDRALSELISAVKSGNKDANENAKKERAIKAGLGDHGDSGGSHEGGGDHAH